MKVSPAAMIFFIATVGRLESLKSSKQMERAFFCLSKSTKMRCFNVGANIVRPLWAELTAYFKTFRPFKTSLTDKPLTSTNFSEKIKVKATTIPHSSLLTFSRLSP
ncbi:hypothetical protein [uncultured Ruminococcus sp.]|uniref:hypothetical protein n=1 Tax=uncultured Ruminococcus sp. TaxID=165186 RepID=UPI0025E65B02|nr:hypothetical protein [uncultured Ruminococcus sp.]